MTRIPDDIPDYPQPVKLTREQQIRAEVQPPMWGMQWPVSPVITVRQLPTSGLATASLIFGIVGLLVGCCTFGLPSLVAVLLGHFALKETKHGERGGHGVAVAGLILGYFVVAPAIAASAYFVLGGGLAAMQGSGQ